MKPKSWLKLAAEDPSYLEDLLADLTKYIGQEQSGSPGTSAPTKSPVHDESKETGLHCPIHGPFENSGDFCPSSPTDKRHPNGHQGTDLRAPKGTSVYAAHFGIVTSLGNGGKGGKSITVKGKKFSTYYAHLDSIVVEKGNEVSPLTVIGTVGDTGNAKGTMPHLHFQVWEKGVLKNPASYFPVPKFTNGKRANAMANALLKFGKKY